MNIVVAMDSFKGSLDSLAAGNAVARGLLHADPTVKVAVVPFADGGEGTVDGDVTVRDFVARCGSTGFTVNGVLTVAPNATVVLENLPANIGRKIEVPIASASEIAGRENFRDARFEGVPGGMRGRLRVSNGVLYAVLTGTGMIVVVQ